MTFRNVTENYIIENNKIIKTATTITKNVKKCSKNAIL